MSAVLPMSRQSEQRLGVLRARIGSLRPRVEAAYERATLTGTERDHRRATRLDQEMTALEEEFLDAVAQFEEEGEGWMEGEEPGGEWWNFQPDVQESLARLYAGWLWQRQREPSDRRYMLSPVGTGPWYITEEASEHALAESARRYLESEGVLRTDVTDAELVEAARDAHEAYQSRRGAYRRSPRRRSLAKESLLWRIDKDGVALVTEFGEKNTARALERAGVVEIDRTAESYAGQRVWRVRRVVR